jgi:hypothetical protein
MIRSLFFFVDAVLIFILIALVISIYEKARKEVEKEWKKKHTK